jgi:hypothetical protein
LERTFEMRQASNGAEAGRALSTLRPLQLTCLTSSKDELQACLVNDRSKQAWDNATECRWTRNPPACLANQVLVSHDKGVTDVELEALYVAWRVKAHTPTCRGRWGRP